MSSQSQGHCHIILRVTVNIIYLLDQNKVIFYPKKIKNMNYKLSKVKVAGQWLGFLMKSINIDIMYK